MIAQQTPPAAATQSARWVTHALELAAARGLFHSARYRSMQRDPRTGALCSVTVQVASQTTADAAHTVTYATDASAATVTCDCIAASYGKPCCHAGAAIVYGVYVARLYSPEGQAEAQRSYERDLAHQQNAACMGYGA